jgi:hypothetical protein
MADLRGSGQTLLNRGLRLANQGASDLRDLGHHTGSDLARRAELGDIGHRRMCDRT